MDSPQRDPNPTLSNLQESPFFKYLCSLSPIKTTKCVYVPQTYSEMTFPPPPTVFVSPPVSAHKGLSLLRSCILTNDQRNLVSETTVPAEITIEPGTLENLWLNQNKTHLSGSPQEAQYEFCFVTDYCDRLIKTGDVNEESCICPSCRSSSNWYETKHIEQDLSEPFTEDLCGTDSEVTVKQTHVDDTLGQPIKVSTERSLVIKLVQGSSIESFDGSREAVSGKSKAETSAEGETVRMDDLRFSNDKHVENSGQKHKPTPVSEVPDEYMSRNDNLDVLEDLVLQELIDLAQEQSASTLPNGIITQSLEKSSEVLTSRLHDREIVNCVEKAATQLDVPEGDGRIKQDLSLHTYSFRQGRFSSGTGTSNWASGIGPRGFRRRCLDFEISEARRKNLGSKVPLSIHDTGNAFESTSFGRSKTPNVFPSFLCERTAATSDATNSEASNTDDHFVRDYQSEKIVASPGQDTPSCINDNVLVARKNNDAGKSPQDPASCRGSVSIPSGIGLHLNSLHTNMRSLMFSSSNSPLSRCSYAPLAKEINSGSYEGCIFSSGQDTDFSVGSFPSSSPRLVVSLVENTKINQQAAMALSTSYLGVLSTSTCFQSIKVEQSQAEDVGVERNASSFENLMLQQDSFHQDFLEIAEDTSQSPHSPNRRGSRDKVGEGCKRCKCKKSRCLKLYCECFAAGVYCVDSCTCHECFNKPEYEETVLGTRQQIESRNPLAFAPKILRTAEPSPAEGEDLTSTPASGRHKRGCNCKKSLCLKKYCECYQAGVGCSEGCRCEGCKNVYGQKGVEDNEDKELHFDPGYKDFGLGTLEVIKQENTAHKTDQKCNKDLSPITPSFQLGWQGTSTAKPRHGKKRNSDQIGSSLYLPSASNLRKPSKLLTPPCNLSKSSQSHVPQATDDTETAGSPVPKTITTTMNALSPRWDGLDEICTLTPLLPHPSRPIPTSTSNTDKTAAALYLSGPEDSDQSLRSLAFRIGLSDGSSPAFRHPNTSSLSQAIPNSSSMPATSLLLSTLCNATNKAINDEEGIDGNCLAMIGKDHVEDWIIDDGDATHMPFTTRSSPKQKRVTPPHCAGSKHRLGTAGSPAKRSPGLRKFILQALPPDKQQSHSWGPISTGPDEA